jgi:hypothetical protein
MSLRFVYTADGQFKENDQVKIDYHKQQESKLAEVQPNNENFGNVLKHLGLNQPCTLDRPCMSPLTCIDNLCVMKNM